MVSIAVYGLVVVFGGLAVGIAYAIYKKREEKRQRQAEREESGLA